MPLFKYQAVNTAGEMVDGEMEAPSQEVVIHKLHDQGLLPLSAEQARTGLLSSVVTGGLGKRHKVSQQEIAVITQQLANLLNAGLPLDRALSILIGIDEEGEVKKLLIRIQDEVRGGSSLGDALEAQGGLFSRLYINMVRAGEAGGSVEVVLNRLTEFMERSKALKESVTSALIYPLILLLVAASSVIILLTFVVPQFQQLFEDSGKALPLATQIVIVVGEVIRDYWWAGLLLMLVVLLYMRQQLSRPESRYRWDQWFLKAPLFGDLVAKVEMARLARTLGTLLGNGVAMLAALAIVKETLNNQVMAGAIANVAENMKAGQGLAEPLMEAGGFPQLAVHMIRVGEETGKLESMLLQVADTYDREVQATVKRMLTLLEPVLILSLAAIIAGIIISILVAIMSLNELVI